MPNENEPKPKWTTGPSVKLRAFEGEAAALAAALHSLARMAASNEVPIAEKRASEVIHFGAVAAYVLRHAAAKIETIPDGVGEMFATWMSYAVASGGKSEAKPIKEGEPTPEPTISVETASAEVSP